MAESISICHITNIIIHFYFILLFFNDTATTEIYTLSLHDALPISGRHPVRRGPRGGEARLPGLPEGLLQRLPRAADLHQAGQRGHRQRRLVPGAVAARPVDDRAVLPRRALPEPARADPGQAAVSGEARVDGE